MAQQSQVRNPFMLMIEPEVVLAAIENSERLGQLNRHLCRPLDRQTTPGQTASVTVVDDADEDDLDGTH
jgi:hypothetical protein